MQLTQFLFQDYESAIVLNVVPKLAGNLNLEVLDDLPTLGAVAPGQVLTQDQVKKTDCLEIVLKQQKVAVDEVKSIFVEKRVYYF